MHGTDVRNDLRFHWTSGCRSRYRRGCVRRQRLHTSKAKLGQPVGATPRRNESVRVRRSKRLPLPDVQAHVLRHTQGALTIKLIGARLSEGSSTIPGMNNLTLVLNELEKERSRLTSNLEKLHNAISALNGVGVNGTRRKMSAAGRARIVAAQRARWARVKGQKVVSISSRKRRKLSAATISRIRAAQRARWAKWRKQQRTA